MKKLSLKTVALATVWTLLSYGIFIGSNAGFSAGMLVGTSAVVVFLIAVVAVPATAMIIPAIGFLAIMVKVLEAIQPLLH